MRLLDLQRTVAPGPLIDKVAAKAQLVVEHDDDDPLIESLCEAVVDHLDGYAGDLGRAIVTQTWALRLARFPCGRSIQLPLPPLISVSSVTYLDADGVSQILSPAKYVVVDGPLARIDLVSGESFPATAVHARAVTVTFVCGYGPPSDVPRAIRQAALMMLSDSYEARGVVETLSPQADALLRAYRLPRV